MRQNESCSVTSSAEGCQVDEIQFYDVVAITGLPFSSNVKSVVEMLEPLQIPVVSVSATSDEFSDKNQYPFFFRVVPPDR